MSYDPYDAAMNAKSLNQYTRLFGQLLVDVWPCALIKGQGKVSFDANTMKESQRRTALDIMLDPVGVMDKLKNVFERKIVAESRAWTNVTLPSIKALNLDLRDLHQAWVAAEFKPTGRTFKGSSGEDVKETCFEIVAVFSGQIACRNAFEIFYSVEEEDKPEPTPVSESNPEKATAALFLKPLWIQAKPDLTEYQKLITGNPLTGKYFNISSPEVLAVIQDGA